MSQREFLLAHFLFLPELCLGRYDSFLFQDQFQRRIVPLTQQILILLLILLPLIGSLLQKIFPNRERLCRSISLIVPFLNFVIAGMIGWALIQSGEPTLGSFNWTISLPPIGEPTGFLDQFSFRVDVVGIALLLVVQLVNATLTLHCQRSNHSNSQTSLAMVSAMTLAVVANDVITFTAAIMALIFLISKTDSSTQTDETASSPASFHHLWFGWLLVFGGLAWLVAIAAIIRSAPHGIPGNSTTVISDLAQLISTATAQHPAAQILWEQYQGYPIWTILIGSALVAGLFPLHEPFVQSFASCSFQQRMWLLITSRIALLVILRMIVEPNLGSWEQVRPALFLPAIIGFLWQTLLLIGTCDSNTRLARIAAWSHQFIFLELILLPELGSFVLLHCILAQTAAMSLLCLCEELPNQSTSVSAWVAIGTLGFFPSLTGLFLFRNSWLVLTGEETLGIGSWPIFLVGVVLSVVGLCKDLMSESIAENDSRITENRSAWLHLIWGLIAIASGFSLPIWGFALLGR